MTHAGLSWLILIPGLLGLNMIVAAQSVDFTKSAAQELANLREGETLAEWKRGHPYDTIVMYSHRHWDWGDWLVRAEKKDRLPDGREIIRRASFYVPNPANIKFAQRASEQKIRDGAQLGFIWIETNDANSTTGAELAELTRAKLSSQFGPGQYDSKIWFANAAYWSKTSRWTLGPATFVSAYESMDGVQLPHRVLTFGFLPVSDLHVDLGGGEDIYQEAFDAELRSLDEAIAVSGLGEKDLKPIRLVKQRIEQYHSGNSETWKSAAGGEVVDALKQWLSTCRRHGRRQYAAGLLAADTALDLSEQFVNPDDKAIRKRLQAIGANFVYAQLDGYMYTHGWLKKALRLDRGGLIGDLSLIDMMEKGFNLSAMCADIGYEGPRRVIFEGERFLSRTRNQKLHMRVHQLVAEAYSDIVALGDGAGDGYVEPAKYQKEARWARYMAIVHYRQFLRLTDNPGDRMKVRKAIWRLRAGAPPTNTNFFCVYD